jgi:hypothetical protein
MTPCNAEGNPDFGTPIIALTQAPLTNFYSLFSRKIIKNVNGILNGLSKIRTEDPFKTYGEDLFCGVILTRY